MYKHVARLVRRDNLSHEEFVEYWQNTHAEIATRIEGVKRYQQIHAADPVSAPCDGLAELYFETFDELVAALGSEGTRDFHPELEHAARAREDLDNFLKIEGRQKIAGRELVERCQVDTTDGLCKRSTFLIRDDATSYEEFLDRWETDYLPRLREIPEIVRHTRVLPNNPAVSEFDGVSEIYFEPSGKLIGTAPTDVPVIEDVVPVESTHQFVGTEHIKLDEI